MVSLTGNCSVVMSNTEGFLSVILGFSEVLSVIFDVLYFSQCGMKHLGFIYVIFLL